MNAGHNVSANAGADSIDPIALLSSLVLEDGRRWGEVATGWQRDDAAAVLDHRPQAPRLHFVTRPRGGSKTLDMSAVALVTLLTQAPPGSTSHVFARDRDQARLVVDAVRGLVHRSGLGQLVDVSAAAVTVKGKDARLVIESADSASAFGHTPFLVLVDELAQWPSTREARALWEALVSGLPKRGNSRLVCITSAGSPSHWSARIRDAAADSDRWRLSETAGPIPWLSEADLNEQRRLLPASVFARLHLNQWSDAEDSLVTAADLAACVTLDGPLPYESAHRYVIGLDLGLKHDRTVLTVCHAEHRPEDEDGPTVVLDRIAVLSGTRDRPVSLAAVEALAQEAATNYRAPIHADPWQAAGLAQRLRSGGVTVIERTFSVDLVGRLAMTLHLLLREHRMALPDDPELLDELGSVRLIETSRPGTFRLDHDHGKHDDRAVALGLAALALTEEPTTGQGSINVPTRRIGPRKLPERVGARPTPSIDRLVRQAAREQSPAARRAGLGLIVPGSANDPDRR